MGRLAGRVELFGTDEVVFKGRFRESTFGNGFPFSVWPTLGKSLPVPIGEATVRGKLNDSLVPVAAMDINTAEIKQKVLVFICFETVRTARCYVGWEIHLRHMHSKVDATSHKWSPSGYRNSELPWTRLSDVNYVSEHPVVSETLAEKTVTNLVSFTRVALSVTFQRKRNA